MSMSQATCYTLIMGEKQTHILIVDDDEEIRTLLGDFLRRYQFDVSLAADGIAMWQILEQASIDLILLDVMLPGEDGFSLCRKLHSNTDIPIIMLTAIGEDTDRILGLEMGADDYIPKPFNSRELLARVRAVLRRTQECAHTQKDTGAPKMQFAGWTLDLGKRELISPDGFDTALSAGEYDLLVTFIEHPQRVLSRDQLLDMTRNRSAGPFDRSIDVQISRLRQKIENDPKNPQLIKTIRGGGYMFTPQITRS